VCGRLPVLEWSRFHFSYGVPLLLGFRSLAFAILLFPVTVQAATLVEAAPVPAEMRSSAFTITVSGKPVDVAHAAASYEFVSFDITGPVDVAITAAEPGFWDRGVDIQPWRLGLRPSREGQTIRFRLAGPAKLSISRPGDFLNYAKMLYLFAGTPPPPMPRDTAIRAYQPGVYHGSLNPKSGETLYLAPGSYFYGSLNLWKVHDVHILGRGTIVYEGPQDPNTDEGWMQKPDWHCIAALESHNVEIDGLTCIVRARTWSIQMKDTSGFTYDDLRVIGGNPGNANQDGMDWLGGGDAIVRNSFLRASDDVFAMQGNWDGYKDEDIVRPGHDVQNILIENSVVSTSISNIVRAGWPRKLLNSRNFTLRDTDVLHGGIGAYGTHGANANYTFENLYLDNWYSLVQLEMTDPVLEGVTFRNIWALDQPPMVASTITGQVRDVTFDNIKAGQQRATGNADLPLVVSGGAAPALFVAQHGPLARFTVDPPVFAPGQDVTFTAQPQPGLRYTWLFGDGTQARGAKVHHRFPDAMGTELDGEKNGAGRFRVLLQVRDPRDQQDWASQGLTAVSRWHDPVSVVGPILPGLSFQIYPGSWTQLPNLASEHGVFGGESLNLQANAQGFTRYAVAWDGLLDIPADGGYTFDLMARDGARLVIDGVEVAKTGPPFAQVCDAPGNAMRFDRGSLGLRAGQHTLHVEGLHSLSDGAPELLWEGPGLPLIAVPSAAFSHPRLDVVKQGTPRKQ